MPIDIGGLITRSPEIRGNRPRIAGTGVTVRRIAQLHNWGANPDDIVRRTPHLHLDQVHAALAYYYANQAEIDADIDADIAAEQAAVSLMNTQV